jgi:hypothetical protein
VVVVDSPYMEREIFSYRVLNMANLTL